MDDPVAVALEHRTGRALGLPVQPSTAALRCHGIGGERGGGAHEAGSYSGPPALATAPTGLTMGRQYLHLGYLNYVSMIEPWPRAALPSNGALSSPRVRAGEYAFGDHANHPAGSLERARPPASHLCRAVPPCTGNCAIVRRRAPSARRRRREPAHHVHREVPSVVPVVSVFQ